MSRSCNSKAELWKQKIESWKASGLSQKKWCEENTVSLSTLRYWLDRVVPRQEVIPQFTEVVDQIADNHSTGLQIRIGAASIEVAMDFDEKTLQRLVKALGDAS